MKLIFPAFILILLTNVSLAMVNWSVKPKYRIQ